MPRSISHVRMWFFVTVLIMHQATNVRLAFLFFVVVDESYDRYNDPKNTEAAITFREKKKKKVSLTFV